MNRRSFLKWLGAAVGVSAVPDVDFKFSSVPEPEWAIENIDFGAIILVGAKWVVDGKTIRYGVMFPCVGIDEVKKDEVIALGKQALRQWYLENHS
jgi:hypothetical protein